MRQLLWTFCKLKKKKYTLLIFQNITQTVKKIVVLTILNEKKIVIIFQ